MTTESAVNSAKLNGAVVSPKLNSIWTAEELGECHPNLKAHRAIATTLNRLKSDPTAYYRMGLGTSTYAQLTEAFAALEKEPLAKVRQHFMPDVACDVVGQLRRIRDIIEEHRHLDWSLNSGAVREIEHAITQTLNVCRA